MDLGNLGIHSKVDSSTFCIHKCPDKLEHLNIQSIVCHAIQVGFHELLMEQVILFPWLRGLVKCLITIFSVKYSIPYINSLLECWYFRCKKSGRFYAHSHLRLLTLCFFIFKFLLVNYHLSKSIFYSSIKTFIFLALSVLKKPIYVRFFNYSRLKIKLFPIVLIFTF